MDTYNDPTPWVNPFTGERFATLPLDENDRPIQGLVRAPRERDPFVADAD